MNHDPQPFADAIVRYGFRLTDTAPAAIGASRHGVAAVLPGSAGCRRGVQRARRLLAPEKAA